MNTEQLKNFLIVADVLNFHKAAERIYIAQPALSRQVKNLEEELGAELFNRSKKQIKLTAAGAYFKTEAARILEQLVQAKQRAGQIHRGEAGTIRIGHVSSVMQSILPPFLKSVMNNYPDLKIGLYESDCNLVIGKIENRELEFGIIPNMETPDNFEAHLLYKENFVVVMPEALNIKIRKPEGLKQLSKCDWILPAKINGEGYAEMLNRLFQKSGFTPNVIFESPNASTNLRLVSEGLGVTIIGKSAMNGSNLNIKYTELKNIPEKVEMRLIWLKDRAGELKSYIRLFLQLFNQIQKQGYKN